MGKRDRNRVLTEQFERQMAELRARIHAATRVVTAEFERLHKAFGEAVLWEKDVVAVRDALKAFSQKPPAKNSHSMTTEASSPAAKPESQRGKLKSFLRTIVQDLGRGGRNFAMAEVVTELKRIGANFHANHLFGILNAVPGVTVAERRRHPTKGTLLNLYLYSPPVENSSESSAT